MSPLTEAGGLGILIDDELIMRYSERHTVTSVSKNVMRAFN